MIHTIHQVVTNYSRRDAVGADTFLMQRALHDLGFKSEIFHEETGEVGVSRPVSDLVPHLNRQDHAILLHFSIASDFAPIFSTSGSRKIVRYHNITPPEFFAAPGEYNIRASCSRGRQQLPMLAYFSDLVIADSAYNGREFSTLAPIPVSVVPVFRDYEGLLGQPDDPNVTECFAKLQKPVLLFVGRICSNKAQHDLLKLVAAYRHIYGQTLGLVLVGGFFSPMYRDEIISLAAALNLKLGQDLSQLADCDLVITGSVSDSSLASLYRSASVYCSMSEHEGFGVPLVEAQFFNLPVMAHKAAAVPEIIGSNAHLFDKNRMEDTVLLLRRLLTQRSKPAVASADSSLRQRFSLPALQNSLAEALQGHGLMSKPHLH